MTRRRPAAAQSRTLRAGLVLAAIAILLFIANLARAAEWEVSVGSAAARPGDVVEIPVTYRGSGVSAVAFVVEFDAERLVLDGGGAAGSKVDLGAPAAFTSSSWLGSDEASLGIVIFDRERPIESLPEGELARLRFRIRPDASGPHAEVRIVPESMSAADATGLALAGAIAAEGIVAIAEARPLLALSTSHVHFGSIAPGSAATQTVVAFNAGSGTVAVDGARIDGGGGAFSIDAALPRALGPGESVPLKVRFSAPAVGQFEGRLVVAAAGSELEATLRAVATASEFFLDRRVLVPAVARTDGAYGSRWLSSLDLHNAGAARLRVRATLIRSDHGPAPEAVELDLEPGTTRSFGDAVGDLFGDRDAGGALLLETSSDDLVVRSATSNRLPDGSRLSQSVPAIDGMRLFRTGELAHLIALEQSERNRTSVSVVNAGLRPATLRLELFDRDGSALGSREVAVPSRSVAVAVPIFDGVAAGEGMTVVVSAVGADAEFFTYASTIDAISGAALFQSPR